MRNRISLIPIAALMLGACGDKTPKSSDANAAEVSTTAPETPGVARPPAVATGPGFESSSSQAFRLLGRVKGEVGDTAGAVAAYQHAIVLDGRDAWSMNNLARVYIVQGRFQESLGPLARAIEIDSTVTTFQHNLRIALKALKQDSATVDLSELARGFVEQTKSWH